MVNGKVTVVGSTSFGFTGCPTTAPPVFARITAGKDWILANSDAGNYQCSNGAIGKLFQQYNKLQLISLNCYDFDYEGCNFD